MSVRSNERLVIISDLLIALTFGLTTHMVACSGEPEPAPDADAAMCEAGTLCPCRTPFDCPPGETCLNQQCVPGQPDLPGDAPDLTPEADIDVAEEEVLDLEPDLDEPDVDEDPEMDIPDEEILDLDAADIPACEDDAFDEPRHRTGNDSCARALSIVGGPNDNLVLCPSDPLPGQSDDYYSYAATAHQELTFRVATSGTLAATLFDTSCTSPGIAQAVTVEGGYAVSHTTCGQETVKLWVGGNVETRTEYSVEVTSQRVSCADDAYEPAGDTRDGAIPVVPGEALDLVFCDTANEADWYRFNVPERGYWAEVTATFEVSAICNGLDLSLWRQGATTALEISTPTGSGARLRTEALEPGSYDIEVGNGVAGEGPYRLDVVLHEIGDCAENDTFHEPDNTPAQAQATGMPLGFDSSGNLLNPENFTHLLMCEDDETDLFALSLSARTLVELEIDYVVSTDPIRVWVYSSGGEPEPSNRLLPVDQTFTYSTFAPVAETRLIRIQPGFEFQRNYYGITARRSTCSFDSFELNNRTENAYRFGSNSVNEPGLTLCPTDDTIDWYSRPIGSYRNQRINVFNQPGQAVLMSLYHAPVVPRHQQCELDADCPTGQRCLGSRGCASALVQGAVPASQSAEFVRWTGSVGGDYLLALAATQPASGGTYGFRWSDSFTCPQDGFGDNHSAENAYELTLPPAGALTGDLCVVGATIEDDDYFELTVPANTQLNVSAAFPPGDQVRLQLPCGSTPLTSTSGMISASLASSSSEATFCFMVQGVVSASPTRGLIPYEMRLTTRNIEATCTDDLYEPNDSIGEASPLTSDDPWTRGLWASDDSMTLCGTSADYYEIDAVAGDDIVVQAQFDADRGDLDLELRGPCNEGTCSALLAQATGVGDGASMTHTMSETGSYVIGVLPGGTDLNQVYGLSTTKSYICSPSSDPHEPNDSFETASLDGPDGGAQALGLCSAGGSQPDFDWFTYPLQTGDTMTVTLSFEHDHGNIDLDVWHDGERVASSTSTTDMEEVELTANGPGDYGIEIYALDGRDNPYTIEVSIDRPPCPDDRMAPNDTFGNAVAIVDGTYDGLVLCPLGQDWMALEITAPCLLTVSVLGQVAGPEEDLAVELYHEDDLPGGEPILIGEADRDLDVLQVDLGADALGTYLVRVLQPEEVDLSEAVPYSLEVHRTLPESCPPDRFEPNDASDVAARLIPNSELAAFACDDDWYVVHAFTGQTLTANLDYSSFGGEQALVSLYLEPDGSPVAGPGQRTATYKVQDHTELFVHVSPEASERAYRLRISAGEADAVCALSDPLEEDDSPAQANPLSGPTVGYLCDAVDFFSLTPPSGQDVRVDLTHPPTSSPTELDMVNGAEVVLGSGQPVNPSFMSGWFTWLTAGTAYLRLADPDDEVNAPYWIEASPQGPVTVDTLEPNDGYLSPHNLLPTSVGVVLSNLSLSHQSDLDFYRFTATGGRRVGAQLALTAGDALLRLYGPDGVLIMESNRSSSARPKEAVWTIAPSGGYYVVEVAGPTPAPAMYSLTALNNVDSACTDTGSNRSFDTAASITVSSSANQQVCAGPGDWYRTSQTVGAGQTITIEVSHRPMSADLDIEIYGSATELLGHTYSLNATESLTFTATAAGQVTFRVFVDDGGASAPYLLSLAWD